MSTLHLILLIPALIGLASRPEAGKGVGVELRLSAKPGVTDESDDWLGERRRIAEGGEIMYEGRIYTGKWPECGIAAWMVGESLRLV